MPAMPRRKTYGYLMLMFLVLSGLAGTPFSDALSKKERKFAADHMKTTKSEVQAAVKGLTEAQLNFKAAADKWSVQDCLFHIAASEKNLWVMLEGALKGPATPEKKSEVKMTDEQVVKVISSRENKVKTFAPLEPLNTGYKTLDEAMNDFKTNRANHIKYIKATSEDLRNRFVQLPFGTIDCYQFCLFISAHTNRHVQQMNEVKADAGFPK
jgi:hypothetical protein